MAKNDIPEAKENLKELLRVYGIVRDTCSICLGKFTISKNFCSVMCGHQFHSTCLMEIMKIGDVNYVENNPYLILKVSIKDRKNQT
jgi:hypothetical protein